MASPITQLQPGAWGGQRYSSFAGKPAIPHPVGTITQLQLGGWGGMRYSSFAGRSPAPVGTQFFLFCPEDLGAYVSA